MVRKITQGELSQSPLFFNLFSLVMYFASLLLLAPLVAAIPPRQASNHSSCRFSPSYTQAEILQNSTAFVEDIFFWEGQFHQNNVGYNTANGMTYDGTLLNPTTGYNNFSGLHQFSAASKEVSH